jgi:hypothetical protein
MFQSGCSMLAGPSVTRLVLTRIVLLAHWTSDVAAGLLIGGLIAVDGAHSAGGACCGRGRDPQAHHTPANALGKIC